MTIKELSQLYHLKNEIALNGRHLEELEVKRGISGLNMDGMPHARGAAESQVERLAAEIVDLKAIIHAEQIQCIHEQARLERFIAGIQDSETRTIFKLRFVDGMSWKEVAREAGAGNTPERVRQLCSRFLRGEGCG